MPENVDIKTSLTTLTRERIPESSLKNLRDEVQTQSLIDGVELGIDWGIPLPEDDYGQYLEAVDKEREGDGNQKNNKGND